jgi:prevent-host-death family protein
MVRIEGCEMQTWQMHEAKAKLSELVKRAELDGPQDITLHGHSVAVVLSRTAFERLSGQRASLVDFMQSSPLAGLDEDLVFDRDTSLTRELPLL